MAVANKNTLKQLGINPYALLLQHIRSVESFTYNSIAGSKPQTPEPFGDLTKKTINEILNDKNIKSPNSNITEPNTAVGAYQIVKKFMKGYADKAGVRLDELFSRENQDLMAIAAIERVIGKFRKQEDNDIQKASEALCKIWAGLRCLFPIDEERDGDYPKSDIKRGMSYYADVSINATDTNLSKAQKLESILQLINPNAEAAPLPPGESNLSVGIQPVTSSFTPPPDLVLTPEEEAEILSGIESPFSPSSPIPESQYLQFIQK